MDRLDRKILRILQEDSTLAVADLAKKVGLSTTPCWRRIQKMEEDGVIKRRVALLDPVKVNTKVTVFVSIRTASHSIEWLKRFSEVVVDFPEVVEFYRMSCHSITWCWTTRRAARTERRQSGGALPGTIARPIATGSDEKGPEARAAPPALFLFASVYGVIRPAPAGRRRVRAN